MVALLAAGCSPAQSDNSGEAEALDEPPPTQDAAEPEISNSISARYDRQEEIKASFGKVIISEYSYPDGDVGHSTPGRLDVTYLVEGQRRRDFPQAVEVGSFGRMAEWDITSKFTANPVIYASGGFTNMGITEGCAVLTELRPEGPRKIAMIPDYFSDDGSADPGDDGKRIETKGKIEGIEKETSFKVVYEGSERGAILYRWTGSRFEPSGRPLMEHCNFE